MTKPIFTHEDFEEYTESGNSAEHAAYFANEKIQKLIESWPVVYSQWKLGNETDGGVTLLNPQWHFLEGKPCDTHQARLAFIEEIEEIVKEECRHEPIHWNINKCSENGEIHLFSEYKEPKCKHCGVELEAEWKTK